MGKQINLIPSEMSVPSRSVSLTKTLNKLSTFTVITLVFVVLGLIGGLIYYNLDYKNSVKRISSLKDRVVELERSEQKLILAKDKLSKISTVFNLDAVDKELTSFKKVENDIIVPSGSTLDDINITAKNSGTAFIVKDTTSLVSIISELSKLNSYNKITLTSLSYSPNIGFTANLVLED